MSMVTGTPRLLLRLHRQQTGLMVVLLGLLEWPPLAHVLVALWKQKRVLVEGAWGDDGDGNGRATPLPLKRLDTRPH
jgi:hypothetical protein